MRSNGLLYAVLLAAAAACTPPGATPVCSPSASFSAPTMRCGGGAAAKPTGDGDHDGGGGTAGTPDGGGGGGGGTAGIKPAPDPEPAPPPPPPPPKVEVKQDVVEVTDPIEFDGDSGKLSDAGKATLDDVASELKAHPEVVKLRIEGHAEGGAAAARKKNLKTATARANAVKAYLVSKGIAGGRLTAVAVPAPKSGDVGKPIELHIAKRK